MTDEQRRADLMAEAQREREVAADLDHAAKTQDRRYARDAAAARQRADELEAQATRTAEAELAEPKLADWATRHALVGLAGSLAAYERGGKKARAYLTVCYVAAAHGGETLAKLADWYARLWAGPVSTSTLREAVRDLEAANAIRFTRRGGRQYYAEETDQGPYVQLGDLAKAGAYGVVYEQDVTGTYRHTLRRLCVDCGEYADEGTYRGLRCGDCQVALDAEGAARGYSGLSVKRDRICPDCGGPAQTTAACERCQREQAEQAQYGRVGV